MIESIKSSFTFPLGKKRLKEGKDFTVVVKVGGGIKKVKVTFIDASHREQVEEELHSIAKDEGIELELDIAA